MAIKVKDHHQKSKQGLLLGKNFFNFEIMLRATVNIFAFYEHLFDLFSRKPLQFSCKILNTPFPTSRLREADFIIFVCFLCMSPLIYTVPYKSYK